MDFSTKDICLEGRGVLVKSKTRKTLSVGAVDGFIVFNTLFHFTTKKMLFTCYVLSFCHGNLIFV